MTHEPLPLTQKYRHGLSKIEVVVALAVCAVSLAISLPLVLRARELARQGVCRDNLRTLGVALNAYHDTHQLYPPAAIWRTDQLRTLALHQSRRFDLFAEKNWCQLLLPYTEEFATEATPSIDAPLPLMVCPTDSFAQSNTAFVFKPSDRDEIRYARGNYAMNAGTNSFDPGEGNTAFVTGDHCHLEVDRQQRTFRLWGNGVGGFNVSFRDDDFSNGRSTLVALEEVRAGIHPADPRGAWGLGQIGSSITWAHGVNGDAYGPNNQHPRSDDIINCGQLHEELGTNQLTKLRMPCVSYIDQNFQATARSQHPGGVFVLMLDGATRFVPDTIDPGIWHVMHSREAPSSILSVSVLDGKNDSPKPSSEPPHELRAEEVIENSLGMTFVRIPGGSFLLGRADIGNQGDLPPEAPAHPVELAHPYYLSAFEITKEQWEAVMQTSEANDESQGTSQRFPITNITWDQAQQFCKTLSASTLGDECNYRLPTEAEWEFAARGGKDEAFAWRAKRTTHDETGEAAGILPPLPLTEVGTYPPNELGLYDMRGNAWEWCADWFARDYYSRSPTINPTGPSHGFIKVVRGSDWTFVGEGCKISYPMLPPWKSNRNIGFRVVCEQKSTPTEKGVQ